MSESEQLPNLGIPMTQDEVIRMNMLVKAANAQPESERPSFNELLFAVLGDGTEMIQLTYKCYEWRDGTWIFKDLFECGVPRGREMPLSFPQSRDKSRRYVYVCIEPQLTETEIVQNKNEVYRFTDTVNNVVLCLLSDGTIQLDGEIIQFKE